MTTEDVVSEKDSHQVDDSTTIGELREMLGEEAVNRGVSYMLSLADAQEAYRKNVQSEQYEEGLSQAGISDDDIESEAVQKATSKWASNSEENGLGIDD